MKQNIDRHISDNYEKLLNIVKKKIALYNRDICPYEMFSRCYFYIVENPPDDRNDIPKYFVHYCYLELKYHNSVTNQLIRRRNRLQFHEGDEFDTVDEYNLNQIDIKDCLLEFEKTLDIVDLRVWEVMTKKDKRRLWELASHFDIPQSTMNLYRVRVLNKFKQHYKEYYED